VIKSRRIRWVGHVAQTEAIRNAYNISVRKPEGKTSLGRPRCKGEDDIKKVMKQISAVICQHTSLVFNGS
jgi:hypothetical protein